MPSCSFLQCGARRNNKHPTLTLHRFPVNKNLRTKWIKSIGLENINPRHKMWYICSKHFHETSFNRTLEVTRLRDCAVPIASPLKNKEDHKNCTPEAVVSPRKRRCRAPLSVTEKTMVQNVFKYVYNEEENKSETLLREKPNKHHCARKTSEILGIAVANVFKVLKNIKENVTLTPPQGPGPKIRDTPSNIQYKAEGFLCYEESPITVNESEEMGGHQVDPLSVDSWPIQSVESLQEDHNYTRTLKAEPPEVNAEPSIRCEESRTDSESQDNHEETETQTKLPNTNEFNNSNLEYERMKWIKEANRRKNIIEKLQAKVKILQNELRISKEKEKQIKILARLVRNYTRCSEIDNILSGRFRELCKRITSKAPKKLDYTPNVIKFTISLYYLSPKAYDFVKKYMDLPHTDILQKYLSSGTYIINLDE